MEIYSSENEQIDAVRHFFREHGTAMIFGVVLGVGGLFGWRYWQTHQTTTMYQSAMTYEAAVTALKAGDSNAEAAVASFISGNKDSYGTMAALELAKHLVEKGDLVGAQKQLETAATQTKEDELLNLINLRLARVQFAQNQADLALATLAKVTSNSWSAQAELLRGNIYVGQGKVTEAKAAYNAGLGLNPSPFVESQLRLQLDNIGA